MKVLISDKIADKGIELLKQEGYVVEVKTGLKPEELVEEIKDFDSIIVRSATKVTKEIIEAGKNLKVIGRAGVGLDNVDSKAAKEKGITVVNTPFATSISVAELALGLMFAASRFIPQATQSLKEKKWEKKKYEGTEIHGKTLCIIGCGRIGRELAKMANALGMKVIGSDVEGMCDMDAIKSVKIDYVPFDELLSKSDYISMHLPLTSDTKHMISTPQFSKMKKNCIFINCARGGVVDENALYEALKSNTIHSAGMDVFEIEPVAENKLMTLENFIATPHIGASTKEGQSRAGIQVAEVVIDALKKL